MLSSSRSTADMEDMRKRAKGRHVWMRFSSLGSDNLFRQSPNRHCMPFTFSKGERADDGEVACLLHVLCAETFHAPKGHSLWRISTVAREMMMVGGASKWVPMAIRKDST